MLPTNCQNIAFEKEKELKNQCCKIVLNKTNEIKNNLQNFLQKLTKQIIIKNVIQVTASIFLSHNFFSNKNQLFRIKNTIFLDNSDNRANNSQ